MASEDDDCTDCEGSGICHQTERYCTCSMGRELAALPPEGAAPNGCPICGAFMHLEGAGWEHPHSDTCPLDSIYIEQRHVEAWNARAHHFPEDGKKVEADLQIAVVALACVANSHRGQCKDTNSVVKVSAEALAKIGRGTNG